MSRTAQKNQISEILKKKKQDFTDIHKYTYIIKKYIEIKCKNPRILALVLTLLVVLALQPYSQSVFAKYELVYITVDVYPRDIPIQVDGITYLPFELPITFAWIKGSGHVLMVDTVIQANEKVGKRYIFESWNDQKKEPIRDIQANRNMTIRAIFRTEYKLKVYSEFGETYGGGWYPAGATASFGVTNTLIELKDGVRAIFIGWDKGDSPNSPDNSIDIIGPTFVKAKWKTQYRVKLKTSIPGLGEKVEWYDAGSKVRLILPPVYELNNIGHKLEFRSWASLGPNIAPIEQPHIPVVSFVVDKPYTLKAEWKEFYRLIVESAYGNPKGSGFYLANEKVKVSIDSPITISEGRTRVVFSYWEEWVYLEDEGSWAFLGKLKSRDASVTLDGIKRLVAKWKIQHRLNIQSAYGNVEGDGWYDEGKVASFRATRVVSAGFAREAVFEGWSGDYRGSELEGKIVMDGPKTIRANWRQDQRLLYNMLTLIVGVVIVSSVLPWLIKRPKRA